MKQIDIFKLANMLDFDIRKTKLKKEAISIMIVEENYDEIPGFKSNKVILYNCEVNVRLINNSIAEHIYNYIKQKDKNNKIHLVEVNENGIISNKKDRKNIYQKCI